MDGHRPNSYARWWMDLLESSSMLRSPVAIDSSVRNVWRLRGCELSIRVNVLQKRSMRGACVMDHLKRVSTVVWGRLAPTALNT
ncbi:hypothetical protein KGM_206807 [Danaus plexippus plexippus]|uniref:Uncharacterized protein n=1 Tax=Danaus plexippus plexippus TaxID=278856 RepID=A0A212FM87_DANPL|nr:hypothetical protein KGM_206807 [Danaus plexippus plexippus]